MKSALLDEFAAIVGAAHVLVDAGEAAPHLTDWRGRYTGNALCVVRPGSTEEVARIVAACAVANVAIVPQGGNTGLVGGGIPRGMQAEPRGEVLLSLTRLRRIRAIDLDNSTMTVDAGCILREVQDAAAAAGKLFPLSLAAEGSATIGGNLSTNAGGVQVLRYGVMRDLTLGLEVVLADGRIWDGLRGLRKDNTGYDLKQLFIGAEGTLGLITGAVLKLYPLPRARATAWVAVTDPHAAVALLSRLRHACGDCVSAFEIVNRTALDLVLQHIPGARDPFAVAHPWQILLELTEVREASAAASELQNLLEGFLAAENAAGCVIDAVIAQNTRQAEAFWQLRENIAEAQKIEGLSIKHDVSLPISHIAEFIERADSSLAEKFPGLRIVCFGHLGDGNLHYNPSQAQNRDNAAFIAGSAAVNRLVYDLVNELGGSISAEHGLGQLKREEILHYKSSLEMDLMRAVKRALDPQGLMNPGKVIDV